MLQLTLTVPSRDYNRGGNPYLIFRSKMARLLEMVEHEDRKECSVGA